MNTVVYCRVSSRDQVEGTSLESQEAACREYASRHRLVVSSVFIEQGESAKFADRTALLELLSYCQNRQNSIGALLVWKIDRFARNVEDHYALKAALRKAGVQIISVTEPIQEDPNGKLLETILAGFAQFDNDIRAMRTIQGMQQRLREGLFPWKPPLGYLPPRTPKKTEPDRPDPATFDAIRSALELFATGGYTKAAILHRLRRSGLRGFRGGPLRPQRMDDLLRNPYYAGVLRDPWTGDEYQGRHVAMITPAEFGRIQAILTARHDRRPHSRIHPDFPLRGTVRCPSCYRIMTSCFAQGQTQRYAYYNCFKPGCATRTRSYPAKLIHDDFSGALSRLSIQPLVMRAIIDELRNESELAIRQVKADRARHRATIGELEERLSELISMRTRRLLSDDEFSEQRRALRQKIFQVEERAESVVEQMLTEQEATRLVAAVADLKSLWLALIENKHTGFEELVLPDGYVHGRIRTAETGLLFKANDAFRTGQSALVPLIKANFNAFFKDIRRFLALIPKEENTRKAAV